MIVLGLSFDFHDSAAAIIKNGEVVAAVQEERFSRRKNDARFPTSAVAYCLAQAGVAVRDLDAVGYYEDSFTKFDRVVADARSNPERGNDYVKRVLDDWMKNDKFFVENKIRQKLGISRMPVFSFQHHLAHLAAAYYCSPFERATAVSLDAVGEYETASWGIGDERKLQKTHSLALPHSLGLFYSAFTSYLGFEVNEGEYKVMGLAAYGQPRFYDTISRMVRLYDKGFEIDQRGFDFTGMSKQLFSDTLVDQIGPPRDVDAPFSVTNAAGSEEQRFADIAASVQRVAEQVILHFVDRAVEATGIPQVCMAGGVALNGLANGRLIRERGYDLYVQPASGDAGSAIGAAALLYHQYGEGQPKMRPLSNVYLGPEFDDTAINAAISLSCITSHRRFDDFDALLELTVDALVQGKVVGWYQGRTEWGPRALGNRSILANPCLAEMKERVNKSVKYREPFRPFAPIVTEEAAQSHFECPPRLSTCAPERFMLAVHPVRPERHAAIPAVTHADGTARWQVLDRETNPKLHRLLELFANRTGVPVLMNTSFNLRGEPMVNSPDDALRTFVWSGMDLLVIGNHLVGREYSL